MELFPRLRKNHKEPSWNSLKKIPNKQQIVVRGRELIAADMEDKESYRDTIATVDSKGERVWVYPKKPSGPYYNKRKLLSYFLFDLSICRPLYQNRRGATLMIDVIDRSLLFSAKSSGHRTCTYLPWAPSHLSCSSSCSRSSSDVYSVDGYVLRPYSWKWSSVGSSMRWKEIPSIRKS